MALPPSEELSRWTVSHVSNWLAKCSLSAFRSDFLSKGIDGSKLLRLTPEEVNQKYRHIPTKKRNILISHLNNIANSRQPPTRNVAPQIPPRSGLNNARMPPPPPIHEDSGSDGSWPDDFDDDDDYLEPMEKPLETEPSTIAGYNTDKNHMLQAPEEHYEIPDQYLEEIQQQPQKGLERKPTLVDKLRDGIAMIKERNREQAAASPPPRPPRSKIPGAVDSPSLERRQAPSPLPSAPPARRPSPPVQNILPPEDTYEVMDGLVTETQKTQKTVQQPPGAEANQPSIPVKRGAKETPPPPQAAERQAQKPRYAYEKVKKPGRLRPEDELSGYEWYHGNIDREHAEKILEHEQKAGMFLIRKSERNPKQPYTLVLWHCNRTWNIPIRKKDNGSYAAGKYKEGESEFASVSEIVEHFKVVSLNLKSDVAVQGPHTLTIPAPKY